MKIHNIFKHIVIDETVPPDMILVANTRDDGELEVVTNKHDKPLRFDRLFNPELPYYTIENPRYYLFVNQRFNRA